LRRGEGPPPPPRQSGSGSRSRASGQRCSLRAVCVPPAAPQAGGGASTRVMAGSCRVGARVGPAMSKSEAMEPLQVAAGSGCDCRMRSCCEAGLEVFAGRHQLPSAAWRLVRLAAPGLHSMACTTVVGAGLGAPPASSKRALQCKGVFYLPSPSSRVHVMPCHTAGLHPTAPQAAPSTLF
jgi:hypothetical protein